MKVIVAGSRGITNYSIVKGCIQDSITDDFVITEIVSGHARGVDRLAEAYAHFYGLPVRVFSADWNLYGKSAGYIRNTEMAKYANALIAIWDGKSRGTRHIINEAKRLGLKVKIYKVK